MSRAFAGDNAWAAFVSVDVGDLHEAIAAPPEPGPCAVRTADDMTPEEIAELEEAYGCRVRKVYRLAPSRRDRAE